MSEARDTDLEIKIAFLERHVEEQDRAMLGFSKELMALRRELKSLSDRLAQQTNDGESPNDDRPPHY